MNLKTLYHLAKCSNEFYDFKIRISQHYGLPITADNSKFLDCLELVDTSTQKEQSIIANVSNSLPHVVYVKQGDSTHGLDAEGNEYYIKRVCGDDC